MAVGRDGLGLQAESGEHLHKNFRDFLNADVVGADAGMAHVFHQPLDESLLVGMDMIVNGGQRGVHGGFLSWGIFFGWVKYKPIIGLRPFFGSLFLWGESFLYSFPEGVDYGYPISDILVNAPVSLVAALGLWGLKWYGYVAGFYVYASVEIFIHILQDGPPYAVEIVGSQVLVVIVAAALVSNPGFILSGGCIIGPAVPCYDVLQTPCLPLMGRIPEPTYVQTSRP